MRKDLNTKTPYSDIDIMQGIYEADSEAIKILYDKYSPLLYTLIKKILKNEKHTEEVLADIFLIIRERINYFDFNSKNPYTWLITLAKNRAVYELRKKDRKVENLSGELEVEYIVPRLSHLTESLVLEKAKELENNIEAALNKLTEAQQYVIYLAYYEGLTQQEIAEKLKIPYTTVESKIKTSLINLNENFKGKSSLFTVKNEVVEMIYPFVLGSFNYEDQIKTSNRFKASEPFPWKLLGEYQNLVSLLPIILDLENPSDKAWQMFSNKFDQLKNMKAEDNTRIFEQVSSPSSKMRKEKADEDTPTENFIHPSIGNKVEDLNEEEIAEKKIRKRNNDFEPVIPFKPRIESDKSEYSYEGKKRNYSSVLIIGLIILYVISAVMAYLFFNDRILYYEAEIENLKVRMESLTKEFQSRPEIPGVGELKNPHTVILKSANGALSSGEVIFSYADKRGYLYIINLPILDSDNAYQLWGNFDGKFVSLGVFKVSSRPDYFPFTLPEFVRGSPVEFYLIESHAAGSRRPGSKIYLRGEDE